MTICNNINIVYRCVFGVPGLSFPRSCYNCDLKSISLLFELNLLSCICCFEIAKLFSSSVFLKLSNYRKWDNFHAWWLVTSINDRLSKPFLNISTTRQK